jgi:hypothetical protein
MCVRPGRIRAVAGLEDVMAPISGYVFRFEGKRRPTWRAKHRLPDGRQVRKTIGPARTTTCRPERPRIEST